MSKEPVTVSIYSREGKIILAFPCNYSSAELVDKFSTESRGALAFRGGHHILPDTLIEISDSGVEVNVAREPA